MIEIKFNNKSEIKCFLDYLKTCSHKDVSCSKCRWYKILNSLEPNYFYILIK